MTRKPPIITEPFPWQKRQRLSTYFNSHISFPSSSKALWLWPHSILMMSCFCGSATSPTLSQEISLQWHSPPPSHMAGGVFSWPRLLVALAMAQSHPSTRCQGAHQGDCRHQHPKICSHHCQLRCHHFSLHCVPLGIIPTTYCPLLHWQYRICSRDPKRSQSLSHQKDPWPPPVCSHDR